MLAIAVNAMQADTAALLALQLPLMLALLCAQQARMAILVEQRALIIVTLPSWKLLHRRCKYHCMYSG